MIQSVRFAFLLVVFVSISGTANAACPTFHTLSNGTTADATAVMDNFNYILGCPYFTGNVGIGTTPAGALLDLAGNTSTSGTANSIRFLDINSNTNSRNWLAGNAAGPNFGDFAFLVSPSRGSVPSGTPVLDLASSGNVGIGAGTPAARLDIAGDSTSSGTAVSIRLTDTGSNANSRNWLLGNAGGPNYGDLAFIVSSTKGGSPSGTPVLNLARTGYAGINTGTPAARLDVVGTALSSAADIGIRFTETSTSPNARNWLIAEGFSNYGDLTFQVSSASGGTPGGTSVLYLSKGGTVGINTNTPPTQALEVNGQIKVTSLASASGTALCINASVLASCSSSRRYKENIRDAAFGLKEVLEMRPVTFKWKGRDEQDFGLIAEEVAKIDDRFVTYKAGKIEGVKYPQLTAVLVNAVKQLKSKNDRQASEITRLRVLNTALHKQHLADDRSTRARLAAIERILAVRTAENRAVANDLPSGKTR